MYGRAYIKILFMMAQWDLGRTSTRYAIINNQITSPSFLREDSQQRTAELTIARRKRGRVV